MTEVLTVGALGSVLLQRWRLITAIALVAAVAGGVYGYLSPKAYSAKAILLVTSGSSDQSGAYQAAQFAQNRAATYPLLVTAPEVVDTTRDELDLPYSATALLGMVTVTNPTDSPLVEVAATAATPAEASRIADSIADNLSAYAVDLERSGSRSSTITIQKAVPAREPTSPTSPSPVVLAVLGFIAGLAVGAVLALLLRAIGRTRRSDSDPYDEAHTGLREASRERLNLAVAESAPGPSGTQSQTDPRTDRSDVEGTPGTPVAASGSVDAAADVTATEEEREPGDGTVSAADETLVTAQQTARPDHSSATPRDDGRRGPRGARRPTTTVGRPTVRKLATGSGREENAAVSRSS